MNTEELPINEILLGDLGIVDNHLHDFKYTPFRIFEMIRDSEKIRGVDFKMEYTQVNDKNYCHKNEVTIFSQKLGIKVQGYGKSRDEAENKCSLNLLAMLFKSKFKIYCELHNYFENKNQKYLDIILIDEKNGNEENEVINKKLKIEEKIIYDDNNKEKSKYDDNYKVKEDKIELKVLNVNSNLDNSNDNILSIKSLSDTPDSLENINNIANNKIGNDLFNNLNNNTNINGISVIKNSFSSNNSLTSKKIIEELNKNESNKNSKYDNLFYNDNKKRNIFDESMFFI